MKLHSNPTSTTSSAHRSRLRPVSRAGDLPHGVHGHHARCRGTTGARLVPKAIWASATGSRCSTTSCSRTSGHPAPQRPAAVRSPRSGDFTVEMETGTGKTYVYLRTIFELNKRYGFTKFVIVVPSRGDQGGRLQDAADHGGALHGPLRRRARSTTSSTTPRSSARCAISPPARTSRSWWSRSAPSTRRT